MASSTRSDVMALRVSSSSVKSNRAANLIALRIRTGPKRVMGSPIVRESARRDLQSLNVIEDFARRIVEQGIDGEVRRCIALGVPKRLSSVMSNASLPSSGLLETWRFRHLSPTADHVGEAKPSTNKPAATKQSPDFIGLSRGTVVKIFGRSFEKKVANASADQICRTHSRVADSGPERHRFRCQ